MADDRNRTTSAMKERIVELRGVQGWTFAKIGDELGVSESTVSYHCLRDGIEPPGPVRPPRDYNGKMVARRGSHIVRRFTPDEDRVLRQLSAAGVSNAEIGRRLNRKPHTILGRLMTLARQDERAQDSAHG